MTEGGYNYSEFGGDSEAFLIFAKDAPRTPGIFDKTEDGIDENNAAL